MKEIKDYLHLYLGCEVIYKDEHYNLTGVSKPYKSTDTTFGDFSIRPTEGGFRSIIHSMTNFDDIKLVLRKLSDMTEGELRELTPIIAPDRIFSDKDYQRALEGIKEKGISAINFDDNEPIIVFEFTRWALSKGFDLFNLINEGLAIDKSTLK